jgi:hypothetical protein
MVSRALRTDISTKSGWPRRQDMKCAEKAITAWCIWTQEEDEVWATNLLPGVWARAIGMKRHRRIKNVMQRLKSQPIWCISDKNWDDVSCSSRPLAPRAASRKK